MKNKGDLERDCDELKAEIESHNNKVQVLERTIEHLKKIIDEKVSKYNFDITNVQSGTKIEHNILWFLKRTTKRLNFVVAEHVKFLS